MNWELFSWAVAALMVITVIAFIYGTIKAFKTKNKFTGFMSLALAIIIGVAVYALYGEMIIGLFKK